VQNTFDRKIANGQPLQINYNTFYSQIQTVTGQTDFSVNISRSVSRLKSVFVSLIKNLGGPGRSDLYGSKPWNDFFSPAFPDSLNPDKLNNHNPDGEFEFYMQIGSLLYPQQRIRSHAESMYQLKKCLGLASSSVHNFDISGLEYRNSKFIIGIDTEKIIEAGWTGLNTRSGDLLSIFFKLAGTNPVVERTRSCSCCFYMLT